MNPTLKEPKKRFMTLKRREACLGWLFVSPALIGFSIFTFGSILYSFYLSLTNYDLISTPKWVGFDNYIRAFTKDQYFYKYFGNTLYFVVTLVPIVLALSLLLAILINKKTSWVNNIYRVALFLPSITSTVAVSMVWLWIFNPDMGLINNFLMAIGLNDVPMWLGDTAWSKPALVIMRVWQMGGYYMNPFLPAPITQVSLNATRRALLPYSALLVLLKESAMIFNQNDPKRTSDYQKRKYGL